MRRGDEEYLAVGDGGGRNRSEGGIPAARLLLEGGIVAAGFRSRERREGRSLDEKAFYTPAISIELWKISNQTRFSIEGWEAEMHFHRFWACQTRPRRRLFILQNGVNWTEKKIEKNCSKRYKARNQNISFVMNRDYRLEELGFRNNLRYFQKRQRAREKGT